MATTTTATSPESGTCPICGASSSTEFHRDTGKKSLKRLHLLCHNCLCIFVPPAYYVAASTEKSRYDNHNNDSAQEGYRQFLNQTVRPLVLYFSLRYLEEQKNSNTNQIANIIDSNSDSEDISLDAILKKEDFVFGKIEADSSLNNNVLSRHFTAPRKSNNEVIAPQPEQQQQDVNERAILQHAKALWQSKNGAASCCLENVDDNKSSSSSSSASVPYTGLDFGCGPGPTLNLLVAEQAPHLIKSPIALYDKFYFPTEEGVFHHTAPKRRDRIDDDDEHDIDAKNDKKQNNCSESSIKTPILYDFITATEVAEHISESGKEMSRLWSHVKPGGVLIIQTSRTESHCQPKPIQPGQESSSSSKNPESIPNPDPEKHKLEVLTGVNVCRYGQWHYIRDDTHICLYHIKSFEWLREQWKNEVKSMIVCGPSVVMFVKK